MQRFKITKNGYNKLKNELDYLINVERPAISKAIGEAIELGDLSENAEYSSAKEKQGLIENNIANLSDKLSRADIVDVSKISSDCIEFGATVYLIDEETERKITYKLVSEYEANLDNNEISVESPIGKALLEKKVGDSIEVNTPSVVKYYNILKIEY